MMHVTTDMMRLIDYSALGWPYENQCNKGLLENINKGGGKYMKREKFLPKSGEFITFNLIIGQ